MLSYRREIEGLRAIALVPVILFHAGFEAFSGGFVGVDVFFVISGYLITSIILQDLENKRFSIINFYERRARRILPALFFVMLACIPFAWMWMLPDPLENFGQSLVATSLFSNNILLYITAGYWDLGSDLKPLLHTWSLAVEEQYYLLFPVFLVLAWRFGKRSVVWIIVISTIVSFLLSEWGWRNAPTANFYLAPTRAWELLVGSLAAFIVQKRGVKPNNFLSLLGLVVIVFTIYGYDHTTPFPSIYTIAPVLGVVLIIIYADSKTLAAKLLSTRVLVSIGLISYSAYLWHQPLLSFSKIYSVKNLSDLDKVTVIIATFLISFATWKFIEKPFRDKSKVSALVIWCSSFVLICLFSGIGYWFHKTNGVPNRIFTQYEFERSTHEKKIVDLENHIDSNSRLLIIGDSFARDIAYLFSYQHPEIRFRLRNLGSENGVVEQTFCKGEFVRFLSSEGIDKVFVAFDEGYEISCISKLNEEIKENNLRILFVGTKNFGENLNWLSRLDRYERANLCQPAADNYRMIDMRDDKFIPDDYYLSFISLVNDSMCVPITNKNGELLASDLKHLTIAGVEFFSPIFFSQNNVRRLLEK